MTLYEQVEVAMNRIKEAEGRRDYFVGMYTETSQPLYRRMAESETDIINSIRQAILEASI